jgi:superoxide reductase
VVVKKIMPEKLGERFQSADWKKEKHVPVIECPSEVKAGELFEVKVSIGKEIAHPNTTEHHIRWIQVFFQPDGGKFSYQVGHFEFCAHGESTDGPNMGPVYTHHEATFALKTTKPGTLYALALCNIHGLWESAKAIKFL